MVTKTPASELWLRRPGGVFIRRVSKAPPDWWSVQQTVDKYGLPDIPERDAIETLRLQNSESIERLGTAAY